MHDKNLALVIEDKTLTPRFLSPSGPLWYINCFYLLHHAPAYRLPCKNSS